MKAFVTFAVASALCSIFSGFAFSQSRNPNPNPNVNFKEFLRDYDGDGKTDIAIYRPNKAIFAVAESSKNRTTRGIPFGEKGDIPLVGDYDGDGKTDVAIFRPDNRTFAIAQSSKNGTVLTVPFGSPGDIPIAGDFDGDGKTDVAIYRPSTRTFAIAQSSKNGLILSVPVGDVGSFPFVGDFDGDGKTDMGVYKVVREGSTTTLSFSIAQSSKNGTLMSRSFGSSTSVPVLGDYDGDGKTDIAIFNPNYSANFPFTSTFYILQSSNSLKRTVTFCAPTTANPAGTVAFANIAMGFTCPSGAYLYGVPLTGDWDGDGKTDTAIYQPGTRTFYEALSSKQSSKDWPVEIVNYADLGDFPLSANLPTASLWSDLPYSIGVYTIDANPNDTAEHFRVENAIGHKMGHKISYDLSPDWSHWADLGNAGIAANIAHGYKTALSLSSLLCWPANKPPTNGCTTTVETDMHSAKMGLYNQYYSNLAHNLTPYCSELVSITINWELQGWWLWAGVSNKDRTLRWSPTDFVGGFNQLAKILKQGCPNVPIVWGIADILGISLPKGYTAWDFYPGDQYVDAIGMDIYEQNMTNPCPGQSSEHCFEVVAEAAGLDCFTKGCHSAEYLDGFARLHDKKLAFPEWGANNNDGGFITAMTAWLNDPSRRSRIVELTYWDSPHGQKAGTTGPNLYQNPMQLDAVRKFGAARLR